METLIKSVRDHVDKSHEVPSELKEQFNKLNFEGLIKR